MSLALYRKWRPITWDEVVGQDHIIQTLRNALQSGRVAHAYLFAGSRGTGKTSTARLLAKAVNCLSEDLAGRPCNACRHCIAVNEGRFLDLIEIDAASNTSVEDVRDLRDRINFAPNEGRYKVYIIDEVHMLSTAAFNALLKTLEEPPAHAIFVLATTEVHKIPATVLSRCQRHEFRRLPFSTIADYLEGKCAQEGLAVEREALDLIARQATGSLRDAVSMLDQLASTGEKVTLARTRAVFGTVSSEAVNQVVAALAAGDRAAGLAAINRALDGGADPRQLGRQVVGALRALLLLQMDNPQWVDAPLEERQAMEALARSLPTKRLLRALDSFTRAAHEARMSWLPALPLEVAFLAALGGEVKGQGTAVQAPSGGAAATLPSPDEPAGASEPREPPPAATGKGDGPVADGPLTFQRLKMRWDEVLQAVRRYDPRTQGLLNSCRPLGLEGQVLILGFQSDLLREKMEKGDNVANACKALSQVFGERIEIRCVLQRQWGAARAGDDVPPMEEGGMVATAVRDLGAQVVEVRPAGENPEEARPSA
jgi:DNA polymerase-3 subunit gamma/tau